MGRRIYELAIEIGGRSDERLEAALAGLWSYPLLEGCFLYRNLETHLQPRIEPSLAAIENGHLYGLAEMPNGYLIPCGTVITREIDGSDWLVFYLPIGSLAAVYSIYAYPFDVGHRSHRKWQHGVDDTLADLGFYLFQRVPFQLGLIGHEVSGQVYTDQLAGDGDPRYALYRLPLAGQRTA